MAKKAWDKIRIVSQSPIGEGKWYTESLNGRYGSASVQVKEICDGYACIVTNQVFDPKGLLELAEFCIELSHQLERGSV